MTWKRRSSVFGLVVCAVVGLPLGAHATAPAAAGAVPGQIIAAGVALTPSLGDVLTLETYEQLRNGMTIDEVAAVMQVAPTSTSTMDLLGSEMTTHMWVGVGGGITVMFTDEVATSITQVGLHSTGPGAQPQEPTSPAGPVAPTDGARETVPEGHSLVPLPGSPVFARENAAGTRSDPLPLGTPVRTGDFTVTVHSVRAFASDQDGDTPGREGSAFVVADITVTNHGPATTLQDALPGLVAVRSGFSSASPRQHLSERGCAVGDRLTFGTPVGVNETVHGTTCWEAAAESWYEGVLRVPHSAGSQGERSYVALAITGSLPDAAADEEGFSMPVWAWVAAGVLILGLIVGVVTRGALKAVDKTLFDDSDDSQRLKRDLERLSALAPAYAGDAAPGDSQPIAEKIVRLVDEVQELLRRLKARGTDRHLRIAQGEYAGMLDKIVMFVDPEYLKNILDNPHRWHHPDKRVTDVVAALDAVHDQVVENIRQANSKADLNFQVAMASLAAVTQEDEFKHLYQGAS